MFANPLGRLGVLFASLALAACGSSCEKAGTAAPSAPQAAVQPAPTAPNEAAKVAKVAKVAKIVFVGQKDCCQCTGDRILASWTALEEVLAKHTDIQVERFDIDVDEARADEMEKQGKVMVIPGLYFLTADGKLVKLLQGEVTAAQVAELL